MNGAHRLVLSPDETCAFINYATQQGEPLPECLATWNGLNNVYLTETGSDNER